MACPPHKAADAHDADRPPSSLPSPNPRKPSTERSLIDQVRARGSVEPERIAEALEQALRGVFSVNPAHMPLQQPYFLRESQRDRKASFLIVFRVSPDGTGFWSSSDYV